MVQLSSDPAATAPTTALRHPPSSSSHTCEINNLTKKWVINLSKTPLSPGHLSLLQKGPNFAITPKYLPLEGYIMVVEEASSKLPSMEADELRSDISHLLRHHNMQHNNHSNLNPLQCRTLTQLNRTHPGWYSQLTRGWPWLSGIERTTSARPMFYFKTPTHIKCSTWIPPTASKTNNNTKGHQVNSRS